MAEKKGLSKLVSKLPGLKRLSGLRRGVGSVALPTAVVRGIEDPMLAVDEALVGRRQREDILTAVSAEKIARSKLAQIRDRVSQLSPEQQQLYAKRVTELLGTMPYKDSADLVFQANQRAFVAQVALKQLLGEPTKEQEQGLNRMRAPDAEKRFGTSALGVSAVQRYRDSGFGRTTGLMSGKIPREKMSATEKALSGIWRTIAHPIGTLKGQFMEETPFPQVPEQAVGQAPQDMRSMIERGAQLEMGPAASPEIVQGEGRPVKSGIKSPSARTYEDFIQAALTRAGFDQDRLRRAAQYQPSTDWASLIGGSQQAAYNPYLGGTEAGIRDVQRRLTGTHAAQEAAFQEDRAFNRGQQGRMDDAARQATAAYAAYQRGQGLRQAALNKGAVSPDLLLRQAQYEWANRKKDLLAQRKEGLIQEKEAQAQSVEIDRQYEAQKAAAVSGIQEPILEESEVGS